MSEEDTYNIHKYINCIFPFFKSKFLCNKEIHNFEYCFKKVELEPTIIKEDGGIAIYHNTEFVNYIKCCCCGKEVLIDDSSVVKLIEGNCTQEENPTPDNPIEIKTLELSFKNKIKSIESEYKVNE